MVAERGDVVACRIHKIDSRRALRVADIGRTLNVVARIGENDVGALRLIVLLQRRDLGIQADLAMDIVRMQDDGFAAECTVGGQRAGHQAEHENHCEQKCCYFLHSILPFIVPV